MAGVQLKKTGDWKKLEAVLDSRRMSKEVEKQFLRASIRNGAAAVRDIKKKIQRNEDYSKYANEFLTIAIKKSTKPLIGVEAGAPLFNAIRFEKVDSRTVFSGVRRNDEFHDIARALHFGASTPVTDEMRGMFYHLWLASNDPDHIPNLKGRAKELWRYKQSGWYPLKPSTTRIVMKERPFIQRTFEDKDFLAVVLKNYEDALAIAIRNGTKKK
jgi:hypothetical protein